PAPDKPVADKPKPADDKPKPKADDKKPDKPVVVPDVHGIVKSVKNEGKLITVVSVKKNKNDDEQTVELKLGDKTVVQFSGVGVGEAAVKEGYGVTAWLEDKSKDTAAKAFFTGDKANKGAGPSLNGPITSAADDGKSFTIAVKVNKTEDAVHKIEITDK